MFTVIIFDCNTRYEERLLFSFALNAIIFALNNESSDNEIEIREGDFTSPRYRHDGSAYYV